MEIVEIVRMKLGIFVPWRGDIYTRDPIKLEY